MWPTVQTVAYTTIAFYLQLCQQFVNVNNICIRMRGLQIVLLNNYVSKWVGVSECNVV